MAEAKEGTELPLLSQSKTGAVEDGAATAVGKDIAKEQITDAIGGFGKWQLQKCLFIVSIIWTAASFHLLTSVFFTWVYISFCSAVIPSIANCYKGFDLSLELFNLFKLLCFRAPTDHWCARPEDAPANMSAESWKVIAIPRVDNETFDKCHMYNVDFEQLFADYRDLNLDSIPGLGKLFGMG